MFGTLALQSYHGDGRRRPPEDVRGNVQPVSAERSEYELP